MTTATRSRSGRSPSWWLRATAALLSLVAGFVLLEVGFRVASGIGEALREDESWAIYDPDLGYRPRPGFRDFNAEGLRSPPIEEPKSRFRILMIGDSIPFYGDDLGDTYVGRLQDELGRNPAVAPVELLNAGVKGYTNYQELLFLRKFGVGFEPDLVGVSFCLNDLHRFLHRFEVKDGEIVGAEFQFTPEAVQSVESPLYRLARKSELLVWLRHRLAIFESLVELKASDGYTFEYRPDFSTAWKDEPWHEVERNLREMLRLGREHGFGLFLVVFPFGEQMREDYLRRDREYVLKPQRRLRTLCRELSIPCLDLFDVLDRETHLLDDDIHLTAEGRRLVAQRIAEFLERERLVPSRDAPA